MKHIEVSFALEREDGEEPTPFETRHLSGTLASTFKGMYYRVIESCVWLEDDPDYGLNLVPVED